MRLKPYFSLKGRQLDPACFAYYFIFRPLLLNFKKPSLSPTMNTSLPIDEKELLVRMQQGDRGAFEAIYNHYKHRLAATLIRLLRDDELAKDVLQDLFMRIWNSRGQIDAGQPFRAYLYRIAENLVIDHYRKAARNHTMQAAMLRADYDVHRQTEERIFAKDELAYVRSIINKLPQQQRRAYVLHKFEGKSYREISELMNISPSTINKHIYAAHKFVKEQLAASTVALWLLVPALVASV